MTEPFPHIRQRSPLMEMFGETKILSHVVNNFDATTLSACRVLGPLHTAFGTSFNQWQFIYPIEPIRQIPKSRLIAFVITPNGRKGWSVSAMRNLPVNISFTYLHTLELRKMALNRSYPRLMDLKAGKQGGRLPTCVRLLTCKFNIASYPACVHRFF